MTYTVTRKVIERNRAAGRAGKGLSTPRKRRAVRKNGARGGRPANPAIKAIMEIRGVSRQRAHQILKQHKHNK